VLPAGACAHADPTPSATSAAAASGHEHLTIRCIVSLLADRRSRQDTQPRLNRDGAHFLTPVARAEAKPH
jgi:hypothetical protein